MKRLIIVLLISTISGGSMAGTLQRVERLTPEERVEMITAVKDVGDAQKRLDALKQKIAAAHGMAGESWMEWRSWYEFDGDFILYRYQSHMEGFLQQTADGLNGR